MTAVFRLYALFFTGLPVQRAVCWTAAALAALGAALIARVGAAGVLPLQLAVAFVFVASAFTLGFVLRAWSTPARHRLLPGFRLKMLAAVLLAVGSLSAPVPIVYFAMRALGSAAPLSLADTVFPFAIVSVWTWGLYFATTSPLWGLVVAALTIAALSGMSFLDSGSVEAALPTARAIALLVTGGWVLFAAWYLRAPSLPSRADRTRPGSRAAQPMSPATRYTAATAIRSCLRGRMSRGFLGESSELVLGVALALALALLTDVPPAALLGGTAPLCGLGLAFVANDFARNCRRLWLASGSSRLALLRTAERGVAVESRRAALLGVVLLATVAVVEDVGWPTLLQAAVLFSSTGFFAIYVGLMCVRPLGPLDWAVATTLLASAAIAATALIAAWPALPTSAVALSQVLGGTICRAVAQCRWRDIDWHALRPRRGVAALYGRAADRALPA